MSNFAIVFLAWGEQYIREVDACVARSLALKSYDLLLITDDETKLDNIRSQFAEVIRAPFILKGLLRKTELIRYLPDSYDAYLLLDSDTCVIQNIELGFEKAQLHGIAAAPAPHYSLDSFWGFDKIMKAAGVKCRGQLQYNTGVIFFRNSADVRAVFETWMEMGAANSQFPNDQPFFSLAMELLDFNPYTLSISYNYRGMADAISGVVRIWHSHGPMPPQINVFSQPWPPRRAVPGKVIYPNEIS
jgi:hypothetical protein